MFVDNKYAVWQFESKIFMTKESFASLFEEVQGITDIVGTVVTGTIIRLTSEHAIVDVGLKSEGRVALKEFAVSGTIPELNVGDEVSVFVERMEDRNGEVGISRERAKREEAWEKVTELFEDKQQVEGVILGRVKGGFTVDILGAAAFLPGSQVDVRRIQDMDSLMNTPITFEILTMDKVRGNIVVSRRSILEKASEEERTKLMENIKEGDIIEGVIKNITGYGAFVDLGGIDGLLHVTDISWKRISHPSEILTVGEKVQVQVIRFHEGTKRISLGIKQMGEDPWETARTKYAQGEKFTGKITNIADYGVFVELEEGVEGLVHVSEMSWTKKNVHPGKIVSMGQEVQVQVLEINQEKRRISLGIKQCQENPWSVVNDTFASGTVLEGKIKNITEFGIFIGITDDIDGMVHMSDISWKKSNEEALTEYKKGMVVKAVVLGIDMEKERISLGIKQLTDNPSVKTRGRDVSKYKKNDVVTATIVDVKIAGLDVVVGDGVPGFIKKVELSVERSEQRTDRFAIDEKIDALITAVHRKDGQLNLSVKALEQAQEREAMEQYGSADSGATLGDILGKALKK